MVASGVSVLAVLAVIAQVSACPMTCGEYAPAIVSAPSCGVVAPAVSSVIATPTVSSVVAPSISSVVPTVSVGSGLVESGVVSGFGPQVQERVSRRTYQVALDNNGPSFTRRLPVLRTQATAPVQQKPTVRIPASIPAPRTISNQCRCVKTVVKPQVIEQVVTVPSIQRYIQTTSRPVVERIHYNAVPVNSGSVSDVSGFEVSGLSGSLSVSDLAGSVGLSSCGVSTPVVEAASPVVSAPVVSTPVVSTPVVSTPVVEAQSYPVVSSGSCCSCL